MIGEEPNASQPGRGQAGIEPTVSSVGPEQQFREALARGVFLIQTCSSCRKAVFYPRVVCSHCGCEALVPIKASGKGHVYSTTTVRRPEKDGGDYNVSIIELIEGPRLMTRIEGVHPDTIRIGMAVMAKVKKDESPIIVFIPSEGADVR